MNPLDFYKTFFYSFLFVFGLALLAGIVLTFISAKRGQSVPTTVNGEVKASGISFHITTRMPALIMMLIGFVGLLSLLYKIQVIEPGSMSGTGGTHMDMGVSRGNKALSSFSNKGRKYELPILFYWLFKDEKHLQRLDN